MHRAGNTATGNIVTENRRTNEKAEDTATFPRNFRQIGTPEGEKHIFIEDYVYTYLHPAFLGMNERRGMHSGGQNRNPWQKHEYLCKWGI